MLMLAFRIGSCVGNYKLMFFHFPFVLIYFSDLFQALLLLGCEQDGNFMTAWRRSSNHFTMRLEQTVGMRTKSAKQG